MKQIGHYSLIDEIGRGGQATVYLAEDSRLKRKVALKVLNASESDSEDTISRFRREAEVASKLDHPGICPVYDAGVDGGASWIAMRYVEGETLARRIARATARKPAEDGSVDLDSAPTLSPGNSTTSSTSGTRRLSRDEIAASALIIEKVARALHAAHESGVIHRDIKPANIMITPDGEPILLDLGLARDESSEQQTLTKTGDVFGTPAYMSPEQLTGQRIRADRRTDVYALGAALFEAVTLRRPFEAPTREALYQAILTDPPADAHRMNPRIDPELRFVMETALEKNRNRRYQTALALAEDLARIRKHEPIKAKPPGPFLRLRRWVQRRPATAAILAGVAVVLVVGSGLLSYGLGAASRANSEARLKAEARAERDQANAALAALEQARRDQAIRRATADLDTHYATIAYGGRWILGSDSTINLKPLCRRFLGAYESYGMPLSQPGGSTRTLAVLDSLRARDAELWAAVTGSIEWFLQALDDAKVAGSDDDLGRAAREATAVRDTITPDPWARDVKEAAAEFRRSGTDGFSRFLSDESLKGRNGEQIGLLASVLLHVNEREEQGMALLDKALEVDPRNFGLHMERAGVAMASVNNQQKAGEVDQAVIHASIARALHPHSGMAHCMLAAALALRRDLDHALSMMRRATEVESESPVVWLFAANFYVRAGLKQEAIEAARRAGEIDPSLARPKQILRELGSPESRK